MALASDPRSLLNGVPRSLLIGEDWVPTISCGRFEVEDPATEQMIAELPDASPRDALRALQAADRRFRDFRRSAPQERSDILRRAYELLVAYRERVATVITLEMGKPLAESRAELDDAASFLRWFAEEAVRPRGAFGLAPSGDSRIVVTRRPIGPALLITPWNFPAAMVPQGRRRDRCRLHHGPEAGPTDTIGRRY